MGEFVEVGRIINRAPGVLEIGEKLSGQPGKDRRRRPVPEQVILHHGGPPFCREDFFNARKIIRHETLDVVDHRVAVDGDPFCGKIRRGRSMRGVT